MSKHTPGPWRWTEQEEHAKDKNGKPRYVFSLQGQVHESMWALAPDDMRESAKERAERRACHYDFHTVMELDWAYIRKRFAKDGICNVSPNDADRALIAAAPDLLAFVEAFIRAEDANTSNDVGYGTDTELYRQARAALAKAKGE